LVLCPALPFGSGWGLEKEVKRHFEAERSAQRRISDGETVKESLAIIFVLYTPSVLRHTREDFDTGIRY